MMVVVLAVICALLLGVGFWLYTPDKSQAVLVARYGVAATDFVEISGAKLRVKDLGPHHQTAILLLHGFGASLETWAPWADELSQHYRVVSLDLPGFGLTGPARAFKRQCHWKFARRQNCLAICRVASWLGGELGADLAGWFCQPWV